ncbi:MAG: low specificity L-threonine aldolase [Caldisericota bacterium]|nr:low specificity L-threonine aldolase [Caldisericota bacterium]
MLAKKSFASDNNAPVHPRILKAIRNANQGDYVAYGDDPYTEKAVEKFKEHFGKNIEVYFTLTGTGANVLGLKAVTNSFNSIITAETAHINTDECGAPEKFTGCKLIAIPTTNGKITVAEIKKLMHGIDDAHHSQPRVVSITQSTEMGTVYKKKEIEEIANFTHKHNMLLHMDGARIANAAASLNMSFRKFTTDTGVDILSFGGTKNGMLLGEAVLFFNKEISENFKFIRKQGAQLFSKMRYISAQFIEYLSNALWLKNATRANEMAKILEKEIRKIDKIKITQPVEANGIFAIIPKKYISSLQKKSFFYVWNEERGEIRWMTSFNTTKADVHNFVASIKEILRK